MKIIVQILHRSAQDRIDGRKAPFGAWLVNRLKHSFVVPTLLGMFLWVGLGISAYGQDPDLPRDARWVPLMDNAQPGDPIRLEVIKSALEETTVQLEIPGLWVGVVEYGGERFSKLYFPEVLLDGIGFPRSERERGWYDFPEETGYPTLEELDRLQTGEEGKANSAMKYRRAWSLSVPRPVFPEEARDAKPQTAAEMERLGIDPMGARPGIPELRGLLAVAPGSEERDVQLEVEVRERHALELEFPLLPAGYEALDQTADPGSEVSDGYIAPMLIDHVFYREFKGSYRGRDVPVQYIGSAGFTEVAEISLPVLEYVSGNTLEIIRGATLYMKFLRGAEDYPCPLNWDHWLFKLPFINGAALRESLSAKGLKIEASRSARYLILTPREYRPNLEEFARWKQSKGLNVQFAYVGSAANDDVPPNATAIDNFLESYYKEHYCHGVYVLLVGDVTQVPSGSSDRLNAGPDFATATSDHVYSVLGDSLFSSLYVGRLSVANADQLQVQVDKILRYERSMPVMPWPRRVVLAANSENTDGSRGVSSLFPSKYAQAVNETATYNQYSIQPNFTVLHAGASNNQAVRATNQDVIQAIDQGAGHVLYRGHGSTTAWGGGWDGSSVNGASWMTGHINQLDNGVRPIVYSIACQNNRIRLNSIGEFWMNREEAGAVAHYGACIDSYTLENHERAKAIFRAIFQDGHRRLGPALARASSRSYTETGGGNAWANNAFAYLLLGDPEMTIRVHSFQLGNLQLMPFFETQGESLIIQVQNSLEDAVPVALVNVELANGERVNGFTSREGLLRFDNIARPDLVRIDIHAEGYGSIHVPVEGRRNSLAGQVWLDANGNGRVDEGEAGLGEVTVYLDLDQDGRLSSGEPSTTTDSSGFYAFSGLEDGGYVVRVISGAGTPLANLTQTHPTEGNYPGAHFVVLDGGMDESDRNFGFRRGGAVEDPPVWIALRPNAQPGDPVKVETIRSGPTETSLRVELPGVWVRVVEYGGELFSELIYPEVELGGLGFPQGEGERGWYDFPEETGFPPLPESKYRQALSIAVKRPIYPEAALGKEPQNEAEMRELGVDPAGARPGIPMLHGYLAVAPGTESREVEVEMEEATHEVLLLENPLLPAGYEGLDQDPNVREEDEEVGGYLAPKLIDREFYSSFQGSYQGEGSGMVLLGNAGFTSASVMQLPLAEVRSPKELLVPGSFVLHLKYLRGGDDFECPLNWDHWIFKLPFVNGPALRDSLAAKGLRIEASRSARYLILTPRKYRAALETFARWKQTKGLNVEFAYVGSGATDDVAANRNAIDAFLESYFQEHYCHGVYVLLVGDVTDVPSGRSNRIVAGPDMQNGSSDHVYSVLGSDLFSSLYVGRLSVATEDQLRIQLAKILSQERRHVFGTWPLRVVLAANSENDDGSRGVSTSFPSKYAKAVNDIAGYGSYTLQPNFTVLHAGAANNQTPRATNQDVIGSIDGGAHHVLYRGHGSTTTWLGGWDGSSANGTSWTTGNINALSNGVYPIVYSIACQNNRIHLNSIGEFWMNRDSAGASAHYGASVNSYTTENHERSKAIFRAIFQDGYRRLGPALSRTSIRSFTATGGGGSWENNTFSYLLLGDPEMTIRTQVWNPDIALAPMVFDQEGGLVIQLQDAAQTVVPAALVNIQLADGTTRNGFTGTDGMLRWDNLSRDRVVRVDVHAEAFPHQVVDLVGESPRLAAAVDPTTPRIRLRVDGGLGFFRLESSTDLNEWKEEGLLDLDGEELEIVDDSELPPTYRFYRLIRD